MRVKKQVRAEMEPGEILETAAGLLAVDGVRRLEKSLRQRWKRYGRKLAVCQEEFSETAIHDFRVEARRLLAALKLFAGLIPARHARKIRALVKQQLDAFDDLRDTQVQLPVVRGLRGTFPAADPFFAYLGRRLNQFHRAARQDIRRARPKRLGDLVRRSAKAARDRRRERGKPWATARLLRSLALAGTEVAELQTRINPASPETFHRVRVAFKRFRYMAETLGEFLPPGCQSIFDVMHDLQTIMGRVQDADVLCRGFERFCHKRHLEPALALPLAEEFRRRRELMIRACLAVTPQLGRLWPPHPGSPGLPGAT